MPFIAGLDIGGTKCMAAIADLSGHSIKRCVYPTPIDKRRGIELLHHMLEEVSGGRKLSSIGVSIGGPIDMEKGTVSPLHQPQWRNVPLREIIQDSWHCPCSIDIDTNAAALGEYNSLDKPVDLMLYVTVSTGVGAGLIRNGSIYRGSNCAHPEFGHQAIRYRCSGSGNIICECGTDDCLEALVSGNGIKRAYLKPAEQLSQDEWSEVAWNLGQGMRNAATFYAPDLIVLGGGICTGAGRPFVEQTAAVMERHLRLVKAPSVGLSVHGYDTALVGALHLARRELKDR